MANHTEEITQILLISRKRRKHILRVWVMAIVLLAIVPLILPPHRFELAAFGAVAGIVTLGSAALWILNDSTTNRLLKQAE